MLRQINKNDWPIVMNWMFEIAEQSFGKVIPGILEGKIEEDYRKFPEGFVVSEDKTRLNGVLWFEISPQKKSAFIHAIYVTPEYRGKRISDELMKYLEDYCRKRGLVTIDLNVSTNLLPAINFYKRQGFDIKRYAMSKELR